MRTTPLQPTKKEDIHGTHLTCKHDPPKWCVKIWGPKKETVTAKQKKHTPGLSHLSRAKSTQSNIDSLDLGVSKNRGTPKIIHFNRVFPLFSPSILGYLYFWKQPFCTVERAIHVACDKLSLVFGWGPSCRTQVALWNVDKQLKL